MVISEVVQFAIEEGAVNLSPSDKKAIEGSDTSDKTTLGKARPEPSKILFVNEISNTWRHKHVSFGLENLGNTCYLNSVIQCLQHVPAFNGYLTRQHPQHPDEDRCVVCLLTKLANSCFSANSPIRPKLLVSNLKSIGSRFAIGRQEDAHEFLVSLFDSMQDSFTKGVDPKPDQYVEMTSPLGKTFGGFLKSQIVCRGCNNTFNNYESFLTLSLGIKGAETVEDCLRIFVQLDDMNEEEWYDCQSCNCKRKATRGHSIDSHPTCLIIHLKRFDHSGKVSRHIQFAQTLDLSAYVSKDGKETEKPSYSLSGVVVHRGKRMNSGHYYSYVADPRSLVEPNDRIWYKMNDEHVIQVGWTEVAYCEGYLLFYIRNDALPSRDESSHEFQPTVVLNSDKMQSVDETLEPSPPHFQKLKFLKTCRIPKTKVEDRKEKGDVDQKGISQIETRVSQKRSFSTKNYSPTKRQRLSEGNGQCPSVTEHNPKSTSSNESKVAKATAKGGHFDKMQSVDETLEPSPPHFQNPEFLKTYRIPKKKVDDGKEKGDVDQKGISQVETRVSQKRSFSTKNYSPTKRQRLSEGNGQCPSVIKHSPKSTSFNESKVECASSKGRCSYTGNKKNKAHLEDERWNGAIRDKLWLNRPRCDY